MPSTKTPTPTHISSSSNLRLRDVGTWHEFFEARRSELRIPEDPDASNPSRTRFMAKRRTYESSDSSESDRESDDYMAPPKKKARKSTIKGPSTKAEVTIRATDKPVDKSDTEKRLEKIDSAVIGRIKKALALASHAQTGEDEARAALRMASKLLERHNVTQADIMSRESESEQLKRAGTSIVSLKSTVSPTTAVSVETWTSTLACAMNTFFDCQSYSTKFNGGTKKVDWAFYGLAEQTVAAAHAFEMTYNLILVWSLKPENGKGLHAKNCYRMGVANGLYDMAEKEKETDKERAIKKEQALLKARQDEEAVEDKSREDRLKGPETRVKVEAELPTAKLEPDRRVKMEEIDDEEDLGRQRAFDQSAWIPDTKCQADDDTEGGPAFEGFGDVAPHFNDSDDDENLLDLDTATLKRTESTGPPPANGSMAFPVAERKIKQEIEEDSPWNSVGQLVAFRETSIAIGDDYLKKQGVKLFKGRKRKGLEFKDSEARRIYQQGKKDAEKIDVRQKRLKAAEMDD
ncbi:hypothetical protein C8R43DRAFT_973576 [Mycena crocata]|nr:hypothetical protein C8R43DRAFT_973576 [Mycena crocata]